VAPDALVTTRRKRYVVSGCRPEIAWLTCTFAVPAASGCTTVADPNLRDVPYWKKYSLLCP
jgi:hypothetical protein